MSSYPLEVLSGQVRYLLYMSKILTNFTNLLILSLLILVLELVLLLKISKIRIAR